MTINEEETAKLQEWEGFISYEPNLVYKWLSIDPFDVKGLFSGNQVGKTRSVMQYLWDSMCGNLTVEHHNMRPSDRIRTIRLCSEILPKADDGSEVKNTQYPVLKAIIPPSMIKQDVTQRIPAMIVADPQGGKDYVLEFVAYHQTIQNQAGVQRAKVFIDEHAPKAFYEEQIPRLVQYSSDLKRIRHLDGGAELIITLTPAQEYLDWEYDEIFERAEHIYRTKRVVDRMKERLNEDVPWFEDKNNGSKITIIMASTYDNPTFDESTVDDMLSKFADEDVVDIRGYGLFKQISGVVYKAFDQNIHIQKFERLFPVGIPHEWTHARGIDYHNSNPWACGWCCLSPEDEMFIYDEMYPSPEKLVTLDICRMIAFRSKDYSFWLNLIDPLASEKQNNTGLSALDDINRIFYELQKEKICTGGFWQTWDTKSSRGRDDLKTRLKNAKLCGKPFNNLVHEHGKPVRLPTVWISSTCKNTIEHLKSWRKEPWINRNLATMKDPKDSFEQKNSHFCMVFEGILKSPAFSIGRYRGSVLAHHRRQTKRHA